MTELFFDKIDDKDGPVCCIAGQWGFWDETWREWHGPYENRKAAEQACRDYAESL